MILLQSDGYNIVKYSTETGGAVYLTDDGDGVANTLPSWSYDGLTIVYSRQAPSESTYLWTMDADGSHKRQLTFGSLSGNFAVFSPDGSQILFVGPASASPSTAPDASADIAAVELWLIKSDGSDPYAITQTTGSQVSRTGSTIQWATNGFYSPDGSRIVYASTQSGRSQIWVMNADGTGQTQLTFPDNPDAPDANAPAWSPDGSSIVFWSGFVREYGNIYTINPDGSNRTQLTFEDRINSDNPAWSPDGRSIIFESGRGGSLQTWIMDVDGSNQRVLQSGGFGGGRMPLATGTLENPGPAMILADTIECRDPRETATAACDGNPYEVAPAGYCETIPATDELEYGSRLAPSVRDIGSGFDGVMDPCPGFAAAERHSPDRISQACSGHSEMSRESDLYSGWCLATAATEIRFDDNGDSSNDGASW